MYVEDGKTYAVKRVGSVDLGSLTWVKQNTVTDHWRFYTDFVVDIKRAATATSYPNLTCTKYSVIRPTDTWMASKVGITSNNASASPSVNVFDETYSDVSSFKTAMSGVMLYYELATPLIYELDDFTLPQEYIVNGLGTEEILPDNSSALVTAPADIITDYRLAYRDRIVDMGLPSGTLWATCDIDVTQDDNFCDTPFTYEKSFFSWGNIDGHNPISNSAFGYDWGGVNEQEPYYEGQPYGSTPGNTLTGNIAVGEDFDAARANLGAPWRMPTSAEFAELFANIIYINADGTEVDTTKADKRVTVNGIMGLYIQSKINGARLFFSCSGRGNGSSWYARASSGYYWYSTFYSSRNARILYFDSGGVSPQSNSNRYRGFAVRAVI